MYEALSIEILSNNSLKPWLPPSQHKYHNIIRMNWEKKYMYTYMY